MKRYNYDAFVSMMNAAKEEKHTEWIVLLYDSNGSLTQILPAMVFVKNKEELIKLLRRYPSQYKEKCNNRTDTTFLEYIPLFSTQRGWKWNKKQIISCLDRFPVEASFILDLYLGDLHTQMYFRKIFRKHFKCFLKDIVDFTVKICGVSYKAANCTIKKVVREDSIFNTSYYLNTRRGYIQSYFTSSKA